MNKAFFDSPILNSPYSYPNRHWELDDDGQPTRKVVKSRRKASYITPIPKPKKQSQKERELGVIDEDAKSQAYDPTSHINELRSFVDRWRELRNPYDWRVTPETARLLQHWRNHDFDGIRPFFCQLEAVETLIWLTEVAPVIGNDGKRCLSMLGQFNDEANPGLNRLALKLATGAGKTMVMAMIIAWQTVNAVKRPGSRKFTKGFLLVTPGLTVKDRLRVLYPNDLDNYYRERQLVPWDMLNDLQSAKIVITNYHAFKRREKFDISRVNRSLLAGRNGKAPQTLETEGEMIRRVLGDLMGMKNIMAVNDEAHHCYREKPNHDDEGTLTGDDKDEADRNNEAARLWITGLETVSRRLGIGRIVDLSATPFFLRGSGYAEGTLFSWTMSDFSLMDAIECGIVKLPRVPVADNVAGKEMPTNRDLWKAVSKDMPRKGRGKSKNLDPLKLPMKLLTAAESLYGHYEKTFKAWKEADTTVPPCFIIVCNNTSASKLVYDYISGFFEEKPDGSTELVRGKFELFRNYDDNGNPLARPRTLLIDSEQLESGEALDTNFRNAASKEIEIFRREVIERTGHPDAAKEFTDQELLREVMNTVGKEDRLGESVRCVVSVSMLTEGWDANTVTHILGIRAFGTQLLCEQVIGRALRRLDYELNPEGLFNTEYADVFGIPFDFTAKPVVATIQPPSRRTIVKAVRPERDHLEIRFPRVTGYRVELPEERLTAYFTEDSVLRLNPDLVGPTINRNEAIIGEGVDINLEHLDTMRKSEILYRLTEQLIVTKWRDPGEAPKYGLFNQLKRITRQWMDPCLVCEGGTRPGLLMYKELADMACEKITAAVTRSLEGSRPVKAVIAAYNPEGSTNHVFFTTSKPLYKTDPRKCHIDKVVYDSEWEAELCRVIESHKRVICYVKNHGLGFEVPYLDGSRQRMYIPDFILKVDTGAAEPLNLIVEVKGYRGEDAKVKKETMDTYWIPGVNNAKRLGRWAFAEFTNVYSMEENLNNTIDKYLE